MAQVPGDHHLLPRGAQKEQARASWRTLACVYNSLFLSGIYSSYRQHSYGNNPTFLDSISRYPWVFIRVCVVVQAVSLLAAVAEMFSPRAREWHAVSSTSLIQLLFVSFVDPFALDSKLATMASDFQQAQESRVAGFLLSLILLTGVAHSIALYLAARAMPYRVYRVWQPALALSTVVTVGWLVYPAIGPMVACTWQGYACYATTLGLSALVAPLHVANVLSEGGESSGAGSTTPPPPPEPVAPPAGGLNVGDGASSGGGSSESSVRRLLLELDAMRSHLHQLQDEPYTSPWASAGRGRQPNLLSLNLKFHARHYSALAQEHAAAVVRASRSVPWMGDGERGLVFVGDGCLVVTIDAPPRGPGGGGGPGEGEGADGEALRRVAEEVRAAMGEGRELDGGIVEVSYVYADGTVDRALLSDPGPSSVAMELRSVAAGEEALGPLRVSSCAVAAGEGVNVDVACPGAREGDAVLAMDETEEGNAMRLVGEGRVGADGRARVELGAGAATAGALYLRAFRRGVAPGALGAADASPLLPLPVLPSYDAAAEVVELISGYEANHGSGGVFAQDMCRALSPASFNGKGEVEASVVRALVVGERPGALRAVLACMSRRRGGGSLAPHLPPDLLALAVATGNAPLVSALADPVWGLDLAAVAGALGGYTCVHMAAADPEGSVLRSLIEARGVEVGRVGLHARDEKGKTPAEIALGARFWRNVDALHAAAEGAKGAPSSSSAAPAAEEGTGDGHGQAQGRLLSFLDPELEGRYEQWCARNFSSSGAFFVTLYNTGPVLRIASLLRSSPRDGCSSAMFAAVYTTIFVAHTAVLLGVRRGAASWFTLAESFRWISLTASIVLPYVGCSPPRVFSNPATLGGLIALVEFLRVVSFRPRVRDLPLGFAYQAVGYSCIYASSVGEQLWGVRRGGLELAAALAPGAVATVAVTALFERRSRRSFLAHEKKSE